VNWTAAILAGGRATRFGGRDKSALAVDGRSIRDRQIEVLRGVADEILIVGPSPAGSPASGIRRVPDLAPGLGPLGGLHTALVEAHGDATAVVACDMPYISAALLRHLLELTAGGAAAVVPRTEGGYHPLCAAYTRACIEPAARRLARGDLTVAGLFDDVPVRIVGTDELDRFGDPRRLLANVNTPEDYHGLVALQGHQP
jgi:molybdopterin-guanine dinucleotide biosynthesis protein A